MNFNLIMYVLLLVFYTPLKRSKFIGSWLIKLDILVIELLLLYFQKLGLNYTIIIRSETLATLDIIITLVSEAHLWELDDVVHMLNHRPENQWRGQQ